VDGRSGVRESADADSFPGAWRASPYASHGRRIVTIDSGMAFQIRNNVPLVASGYVKDIKGNVTDKK